jgi:nitrogen fixation protein NifB
LLINQRFAPSRKNDLLKKVGVTALTITINAVDANVGSQIYSFVRYQGKTLRGKKAFQTLNKNQLDGLREAAAAGMVVKVNSVYIPGIKCGASAQSCRNRQ